MFSKQQLPFFVYGTLRPRQSNYYLLEGRIASEQAAIVEGIQLFSLGVYPMAIRSSDESNRVYGTVITPRASDYHRTLKILDHLEGYDSAKLEKSVYLRVRCEVNLMNQSTVSAWIYLGEADQIKPWHRHIRSGDWAAYAHHNAIPFFRRGQ